MNKRLKRQLTAGLAGAVAFAGGIVLLPLPFGIMDVMVNGLLAVGVATGVNLLHPIADELADALSEQAEQDELAGIPEQPGVDRREVVAAIRQGNQKIKQIEDAAQGIANPNAARRVRSICATGRDIIENFRQDPKDVRLSRTWLNSYLDQTLNVVQQYARVSRAANLDGKSIAVLTQFEETLDEIDRTFRTLLQRLLANDVVDLDVDMQVFRTMMRQEGA